jgi:hypothetical protein
MAAIALAGCMGPSADDKADDVVAVSDPLNVGTFTDDSASPVHVQIKICTTDFPKSQQAVDCTVDSGYALVGGGAYAREMLAAAGSTGSGGSGGGVGASGSGGMAAFGSALLTASFAADGRTWHAASRDHLTSDPHHLTAYAVGLRLDGVNAGVLRNRIFRVTATAPSTPTSLPTSVSFTPGVLSGGLATNTSGVGQFITASSLAGTNTWTASSRDHLSSSPGTVTNVIMKYSPQGIIEGFGALEIQPQTGPTQSVSSGNSFSAVSSVPTGWAVIGYGATATTDSGPGRMLTRLGPWDAPRAVIATSRDVLQPSSGATTVSWMQARHMASTHGLCNYGDAIPASADSCAANVCAPNADPYCCNTAWDSICVGEVPTYCGRSCANDTCSQPSFTPAFWNQGSIAFDNDGYNYATNHRTDTFAQPGRSTGDFCSSGSCFDAAVIGQYAQNDGLIPSAGTCGGGRSVLALAVAPGQDWLWFRKDARGTWSYKIGITLPTNLDFAGNVITNPATANLGAYTQFGGYFCACSSSTEGQGHTVIN